MGDYQNDLFKSIDLITQSAINKLQVNKTITCRIIDNSNATYGEYLVNDGSTTYTAYDKSKEEYEVDEQVYVLVPNGDYNNQLTILGRIVSENSKPFNWVSPMENYLNATDALINIENEAALIANGDIQKLVLIQKEFPNALSAYDCLGIKANFKSLLNVYDTVSGTYGLEFIIEGRSFNGTNNDLVPASVTYTWDTSEMYGNPYNFSTFFPQSLVLDIGQLKEINKITISFFQSGDFYDSEHNLIPSKTQLSDTEIINVPHNLFVNNIELSMGYYLSSYTGESVLLYNYNSSLTYEATNNPEKYMKTRLIHYKGNGIKTGYDNVDDFKQTTTIVNGTTVVQQLYQEIDGKQYFIEPDDESYIRFNWYHYVKDKDVNDALAGSSWEFVGENVFDYAFTPNSSLSQEKYKVIVDIINVDNYNNTLMQYSDAAKAALLNKYNLKVAEINKWTQSHNNTDSPEYKRLIDERDALDKQYKSWEEDKAAALLNVHKYYESKELVFTNEVDTEYENALTLKIIDDYGGIYNIYDTLDNTLIDDSQEYVVRKIIPVFKSRIYKANYLDTYDTIDWYYPNTEESMIKLPEPDVEGNYTISDDGLWRIISHSFNPELIKGITDPKEIERIVTDSAAQVFRIKGYFNPFYTNNIIKCVLRRHHDLTYNAEKELTFGMKALNGTKNTLVLSIGDEYENGKVIDSNVSAWTVLTGLTHKIQLKAILYDENTLPIEDAVYNWSIVNGPDFVLDDGPNQNIKFIRLRTAGKDTFANYPAGIVLKCSVNVRNAKTGTDYNGYLALPFRATRNYRRFVGTSKIVYDETGANPTYKDHAYQIYDTNNSPIKIENVLEQNRDIKDKDWYPQIKKRGVSFYLVPSTMIYSGVNYIGFGVQLIGANNAKLWGQPVIVYQDVYGNNVLNQWDGSLTVDEENNMIFASMIGAGKKSADNKFTGVLMGEVGGLDAEGNKTNVRNGLFGYSDGYQSFSLDNNGTATLGRSGRAQLKFDGNEGTIQNANYNNNQGMKLSFDTAANDGNGAFIDIINYTSSIRGKRATGAYDSRETYYANVECTVPGSGAINSQNWNQVKNNNIYAKGFQRVGSGTGIPYNKNTIYYDASHNEQKIKLQQADFAPNTYYQSGSKIATEYVEGKTYYTDAALTHPAYGNLTPNDFVNGQTYYYKDVILATEYKSGVDYYLDKELTIPASSYLTEQDFEPNKYYHYTYYLSSNEKVNLDGTDSYNPNYNYFNDADGLFPATGAINELNYVANTYYAYVGVPSSYYDNTKTYYLDADCKFIGSGPICASNYIPNVFYLATKHGISTTYNENSYYYFDSDYSQPATGPINAENWLPSETYYVNYYPQLTKDDLDNNTYSTLYTYDNSTGIYTQITKEIISWDENEVVFKSGSLSTTRIPYSDLYGHVSGRSTSYIPGIKYYKDIQCRVEAQGAINKQNFDSVLAKHTLYELSFELDNYNEFRSGVVYYTDNTGLNVATGDICAENFNDSLASNGVLYYKELMLSTSYKDNTEYYNADGTLAEGSLNANNWQRGHYYVQQIELASTWKLGEMYYSDNECKNPVSSSIQSSTFTPNTYYYLGVLSTTEYIGNIEYYTDNGCNNIALSSINEFNFVYSQTTPYYYLSGVLAQNYNDSITYYLDENMTQQAYSNITQNMYNSGVYYADIIAKVNSNSEYNANLSYYINMECTITAQGPVNSENYVPNRYYVRADAQPQHSRVNINSNSPYLLIDGADGDRRMTVTDQSTTLGGWTVEKDHLYYASGTNEDIGLYASNQTTTAAAGGSGQKNDWRIRVSNKFGVDKAGNLYGTGGKIAGWTISADKFTGGNTTINANGTINCTDLNANHTGTIGGWKISSSGLQGGNLSLNSNGSISGGSSYNWSIDTDGRAKFNYLDVSSGIVLNGTRLNWGTAKVVSEIDNIEVETEGQPVVTSTDWKRWSLYLPEVNKDILTDICCSLKVRSKRLKIPRHFKINYKTITLRGLGVTTSVSSPGAAGEVRVPISDAGSNSGVNGGRAVIKKSGCFGAGTDIFCIDGSIKPIELIKVGDEILTYNTFTNSYEPGVVNMTHIYEYTNNLYEITLKNGIVLKATSGHPLLSDIGWVSLNPELALYESSIETKLMRVGQTLQGLSNDMEIIDIKKVEELVTSYNLTVNKNHTFIASGVIAHNVKAPNDYN